MESIRPQGTQPARAAAGRTSPCPPLPRPSQKEAGAYYTPDPVAAALVRWVVRDASDRFLDPSCGDGRFLAHHAASTGVERDAASADEARERVPGALVHEADFFEWAAATDERFECGGGNPPFIRYQTFAGSTRERALALCAGHGVRISGLASSWVPFVVATAALLKPGGRMAFVVPAEIGHAPYAAPLVEFLAQSFSEVRVVAVREKLFPHLSADCWLLYAGGYGGRTGSVGFASVDRYVPSPEPPPPTAWVDVSEWRGAWNCRLRPYLLPQAARDAYLAAGMDEEGRRLRDFASVGIGYVTGDNGFFHLRPSEVERLGIPRGCLRHSLRSSRLLPRGALDGAAVQRWERDDEAVLLLALEAGVPLPGPVAGYLESPRGHAARRAYKCRTRNPWYVVPDVRTPDYFIGYMSGRDVPLVPNAARVTCSNTLHGVQVRCPATAARMLPRWTSPLVRLSCELEGHALGGGMLKLEPREAGRLLFPGGSVPPRAAGALEEGVATMRTWRHHGG